MGDIKVIKSIFWNMKIFISRTAMGEVTGEGLLESSYFVVGGKNLKCLWYGPGERLEKLLTFGMDLVSFANYDSSYCETYVLLNKNILTSSNFDRNNCGMIFRKNFKKLEIVGI